MNSSSVVKVTIILFVAIFATNMRSWQFPVTSDKTQTTGGTNLCGLTGFAAAYDEFCSHSEDIMLSDHPFIKLVQLSPLLNDDCCMQIWKIKCNRKLMSEICYYVQWNHYGNTRLNEIYEIRKNGSAGNNYITWHYSKINDTNTTTTPCATTKAITATTPCATTKATIATTPSTTTRSTITTTPDTTTRAIVTTKATAATTPGTTTRATVTTTLGTPTTATVTTKATAATTPGTTTRATVTTTLGTPTIAAVTTKATAATTPDTTIRATVTTTSGTPTRATVTTTPVIPTIAAVTTKATAVTTPDTTTKATATTTPYTTTEIITTTTKKLGIDWGVSFTNSFPFIDITGLLLHPNE